MQKKNETIRKLPVSWIILSTIIIFLLINLPLIYGYFSVHGKFILQLWGYAPQQFIFLLVPLPMATFATLVSLVIIFSTLSIGNDSHWLLRWTGQNWIVIILLGFILSTVFAVFDYYGNPKVFDRFQKEYAEKAVESAQEIRIRNENKTPKEIASINKKAGMQVENIEQTNLNTMTKKEILELDPDVYLRLAKNAKYQRELRLLNPVLHLLSELQLTFALFVGFGALFASSLLFISNFSPGVDLSKATPSVITALAFLSLYPLCFGYWSSEINALTGAPINNVGYLIVGILILMIGIFLMAVDSNIRNFATALPVVLSVLALLATRIIGIENLRILIGVDANIATRFTVLVALLVIGIILSTMIVVQYEESFHRNNDAIAQQSH